MNESEKLEDTPNLNSNQEIKEDNSNDIKIENNKKEKFSEFEKHILEAYNKINTIPITDDNQENIEITNEYQYKNIIKASELDLRSALKCCIEDEKIQFKRFIIDKLNRISLHNLMNINYILGEIYISLMKKNNFFCDENEKIKINDAIYFINRIVELEESVQSTELSKIYQSNLVDFINKLFQKCDFDEEQKQNLSAYIENFNENNNFNILTSTIDDLVLSLNEELNNQKNIYDQYQIFLDNEAEIEESISNFNLNDRDSYDNVLNLGKYFSYYLYNLTFTFYTKQNDDNSEEGEETENEINIKKYYDGHLDDKNQMDIIDEEKYYIKNNEVIEKLRIKLCELIIKYIEKFKELNNVFGIQYILYVLIKRIYYYYYDQYIDKIKPFIVDIIISLCFFEEAPLYNLSTFINKIIKSNVEKDSDLKKLFLDKIDQFKLNRNFLYKLPKNYNKKNNKDDEEEEEDDDEDADSSGNEGVMIFSQNNDLKIGLMNKEEVKAGEINEYYIELSESFCILDFTFQINEYDINLKITSLTEGKVIYSQEKIINRNCPLKFVMLFTNPCILKIEFDNSYSWMKSKQITYKANVFYSKNPYNLGNSILLTKYLKSIVKNKKEFDIDKSITNERILITKIFDDIKVFNCLSVKRNIDIIHKMMKDNYINVSSIFIETSKNNKTKNNFYFLEQDKFIEKELNKETFENFIINSILKNSKVNLDLINLYVIKNDSSFEEYNSIKELIGFEPVIQINGIAQKILFFSQFLHQSQLLYYLYKNVYEQESFDIVFLINYNKYGGLQIATFIEGKINLNYEKFKKIKNKGNFEDNFEENFEIITKEIKELSKDRNINVVVPEFFERDSDYSDKLIDKLKKIFEQNENENKNNDYDNNNVRIIKLDKNFNDELYYISHIFCIS